MTGLADATWPEIGDLPTVLVPVGSIEQHGPHLPFDTDTTIAVAVAEGTAARLDDVALVAPALTYGSSGEHQSFAGTSSIGTDVLHRVVVELVRSMRTWSGRIVFVNAHGGNLTALSSAVVQLLDEGHDVGWVPCATEDVDLHAGITETSLMLHLRPASVRLDRAVPGDTRSLREILPLLMSGGVSAVSENGVLGDPTGADAGHGVRVLTTMIDQTVAALAAGVPDARGRLAVPVPVS
ncbi:MAG: mycofactocin biosynthesis peptidyl-dipeptidase MftE [Aeromicrobium sp.]